MEFKNQKAQRLRHVDFSRKGSIDEPVVELVNFINSLPNYFTTSSCSGRIIVFESASLLSDEDQDKDSVLGKPVKKGCKWLFVTHGLIKDGEIVESLDNVSNSNGNAVFKFEPMVMHVQCHTVHDAQLMHQAAIAAGFRNSGISLGGKGKIIMGVRSTHSLEVPLSKDGVILVTPEYYQFLVHCANEKMEENFTRIKRFSENVKPLLSKSDNNSSQGERMKTKKKAGKDNKGVQDVRVEKDDQDKLSSVDSIHIVNDKEDELSLFMFENT